MKHFLSIIFLLTATVLAKAQTPRIAGSTVGTPLQTLVFRNFDIPAISLPNGTWEVVNGTIQNTYNGGTYTSITVKSTGSYDLTAKFTYLDMGSGEMVTLQWTTLIRALPTPGTVLSPASPSAVPMGAMTPLIEMTAATGGVYGGTSYVWEKSITSGVWVRMAYGGPNLSPQLMEGSVQYRRVFKCTYDHVTEHNVPADSVYSAPVQFNIVAALQPGVLSPAVQTVQLYANAAITATAGSGGSCGSSVTYKWQQSIDSLSFFDITGATSATYTPTEVRNRAYYRRITTCGTYMVISNIVRVDVAPFVSTNPVNENYTRTYYLTKGGYATLAQAMGAPAADKLEIAAYFDGLGRNIQNVQRGFSPTGKDMVTPVVYDNSGRQPLVYQAYPAAVNDGKYKAGQVSAFNTFMTAQFPGESHFHARQQFEESPGGVVEKTFSPGVSWGGSNRGVDVKSGGNTLAEGIRIWKVIGSYGSTPTSTASYADGELVKEVKTDENGKVVHNFKDKYGQMILKKVQVDENPTSGYDGWICTYYVYDDLNQLRFVLSPKAVDILKTNGWSLGDSTIINGLCFKYEYDAKKRMIYKKVPGAAPLEMVYDVRDRLVFSRDGNQKTNGKWLVRFFDDNDRQVQTALYSSTATRVALQSQMNTITGTTTVTSNIPGPDDLVVPERNVGISRYAATNSVQLTAGFESAASDEFVVEVDPALAQTVVSIQANNPLPGITPAQLYPLSYTYYDRYDASAQPFRAAYLDSLESGTSTSAQLPTAASKRTQGLVTSTKIRILDTDSWILNTNYYDNEGRILQTISGNLNGGTDILTSRYDFSGKVLSFYLRQQNPLSVQDQVVTTLTVNKYDYGGRLISVEKELNGQYRRTIGTNEYNELGQLKKKTLGNNIESLDYEYNIRGWLRGINRSFAQNGTGHYFGTSLHYNDGLTTSQYNGDIAATTWRSAGDNVWRSYDFAYDAASRLKGADFKENTGSAWQKNPNVDFTVSALAYDANGNIASMTQKGMKNGTSSTIDQLVYTYPATSNQLGRVVDATNDPQTTLGDFKDLNPASTVDYLYDPNGNLVFDNNKNIQSIQYNHLNLPSRIHIRNKGTISYVYDANGLKIQKIVVDSTYSPARKTVIYYAGVAVYTNDSLQFLSHEEGRVRPVQPAGQPRSFVYDYFLKDHLGNIRMVLTEESNSAMYAATMEVERAPVENALFSNIDASRAVKPVGYPQSDASAQNEFVAKLKGNDPDKRIGPSVVLKVMVGDTVTIGARAFYKSAGIQEGDGKIPVEGMLSSLIRAIGGDPYGGGHGSGSTSEVQPFNDAFLNNDYERLKKRDNPETISGRPKAYLNFVLFDERFKLVEENSGVKQVKREPDQLQALSQGKMVVQKGGFLYVYASNETPQDVYFDDVTVELSSGPVLEETHYYPFGLTMDGISYKALYHGENRYKYNGIEKIGDLGLEDYDARFRELDPQIGRWWQVDPKTEKMEMWSPYVSNYNNPIRYSDILGDEPGPGDDYDMQVSGLQIKAGIKNFFSSIASHFFSDEKGRGGRMVYRVEESFDWDGRRTAEIVSHEVFDNSNAERFLNKDVAHGALSLASLTPMGKAGALNGPMMAAKAGPTVVNEGVQIAENVATKLDGSFSILDWSKYPTVQNVAKPKGPFKLLEGTEYSAARAEANSANAAIHRKDPLLVGQQIHEIQPVKFGGSPTDPANKVYLSPQDHRQFNAFWDKLRRDITGK